MRVKKILFGYKSIIATYLLKRNKIAKIDGYLVQYENYIIYEKFYVSEVV
jgi:hypothetical protein